MRDLARALTGLEALRGMDLVLRARSDKAGLVVLAYDVLKSPAVPILDVLPRI
jgi:hypothetical protein